MRATGTSSKFFAAVVCATLSGCIAVPMPRNATLKTGDGPLVQAHRGSRGEYDDNALGGFKMCLERGIRGFETDIRFTKDKRLVIMHDNRVNRTTDGKGIVEEMTLTELGKGRLQACSEPVPTLEEVLSVMAGRDDVFVELEMKAYPGGFYTPEVLYEYCRALNAAAKKLMKPGTYAFTCFNTNTLATMRRADLSAPIGYIVGTGLTEEHIATAKSLGCCGIAPLLSKTTKEMVARAHEEGLTICLWMCQDAAAWREAREKGADRVTSDYPVLLTRAIEGRAKKVVAMDLDATLAWAKDHGYTLDDDVFIGDDFADGGGDSHVRIKGMDHIVIANYKNFANAVNVLLK